MEESKIIPIDKINIGDRYRDDYGDVESLAVSIERHGLLHPIIIDDSGNLIAGERRYRACKSLGMTDIRTTNIGDVSEEVRLEIEFEENAKRKDLTWQETILAVKRLFDHKQKIHGKSVRGHDIGGFTLRDLAIYLNRSLGSVAQDIQLANSLEDGGVSGSRNKATALKVYKAKKEKAILKALTEKVKTHVDLDCLVNGDCNVELRKLKTDSADMVFMDPPFGIDLKMKTDLKTEDDKPYVDDAFHVMETIDKAVRECFRVLKDDRVMLLFHDIRHYTELVQMCREAGFQVCDTPITWVKTGGGGPLPNRSYYSKNTEQILHCQKGNRELNNPGEPNYKVEARVPPQYKIHPTQRPSRLLRYYIEQHTMPGELVIDPFAGSASTLCAAFECGRQAWGCELDEDFYNKAIIELERIKKEVNGSGS